MLPSIFGENLFDDLFDFPTLRELRNIDRKLYGRNASHEMKTDVMNMRTTMMWTSTCPASRKKRSS